MRRWNTVAGIAALAMVYYFSGKFGLSLATVNPSASAVWPPTGIALAGLLLWGLGLWPGVFIGAFLVNISTQGTLATSLVIAAGNTLEAVAATALLQRYAGGLKALERVRGIFEFIFLAAFLSTLISATFGVTALCAGHYAAWSQYPAIWLTWWLGDATSNLVVAPLLLTWFGGRLPRLPPLRCLEAAGLMLLVVLTGLLVFSGKAPLEYLILLPVLCVAFRFGKMGTTAASAAMSAIAVWYTAHGFGPFESMNPNRSLLLLQAFTSLLGVIGLMVAGVVFERAEAERNLARTNEDLEWRVSDRTAELKEINSQLEELVYSLAHDLRAPLRAMQGFSRLLLLESASRLDGSARDYAQRIEASAAFMDKLLTDLLLYSKVAHSEVPLVPVKLDAPWQAAVAQNDEAIRSKGARIEIATPLPAVLAHEATLGQVLANLLANALKFTTPGVTPWVRLWAEERSGYVRLWVEDNGIGIAAKYHERVFRIFERLERLDYAGTGIGLSIVRKGIERMGGRVGLESAAGQGSRFWVELRAANHFAPATPGGDENQRLATASRDLRAASRDSWSV